MRNAELQGEIVKDAAAGKLEKSIIIQTWRFKDKIPLILYTPLAGKADAGTGLKTYSQTTSPALHILRQRKTAKPPYPLPL